MFPPRAPLPERIGAYTVLRRLPSPDGADRYLGREDGPRGFTRAVELKVAPAEDDPDVASELAHEAAIVSRLNHPAILRMFHFFEHEGRLVLVLERVEGTTLARILASGRRRKLPLPDDVVFHVAHRLMGAIAHAHNMIDENGQRTPVVHRAISPTPMLVGWGGEVRLSGFGLAKIVGRSPDTAVGLVKGTPGYMAPEQLRGERVTERTDIYQAGLVIWEMLSGNPPAAAGVQQKSREAELVQMMSGPQLAPVSALRPSVPREIAAVIDAMLEPAVDKRKISAAEVERWLAKTTDVERGRETLRERAIVLRGQEAREATEAAPPARPTAASARRTTLRRTTSGELSLLDGTHRRPSGPRQVPSSAALDPSTPPPGVPAPPPPPSSGPAAVPAPPPPPPSRPTPPTPAPPVARLPPPTPSQPSPSPFGGPPPSQPSPFGGPSPPPLDPPFVPAVPAAAKSDPIGVAAPLGAPPQVNPSRVTRPDEENPGTPLPPQPMAVEGDRSASTLITRLIEQKPRQLLVAGAVFVAVLLLTIVVVIWRAHSDTADEHPKPLVPSGSVELIKTAEPPPTPPDTALPVEPPPLVPSLGPRQGALLVKSSAPGNVYVNGGMAGETNKVLVVACGQRFVRVAAPTKVGGRTLWLTPGMTVKVPCGVLTEVNAPAQK